MIRDVCLNIKCYFSEKLSPEWNPKCSFQLVFQIFSAFHMGVHGVFSNSTCKYNLNKPSKSVLSYFQLTLKNTRFGSHMGEKYTINFLLALV